MKLRCAALLILLAGCEGDPGSAPQPFTLASPGTGATAVLVTSSFSWGPSIRADTYSIEIGTDPTFATTLFAAADLTVTTFTPPASLPMSTTLYWHVTAINEKGAVTSATANFNSEGLPGAFSLATPADTATGVASLPTYTWTAAAVADTYLLEITTDPTLTVIDFSLPGITTTTATPAFALTSGIQYFWRVTAQNTFGTVVATGAPFSFTTA